MTDTHEGAGPGNRDESAEGSQARKQTEQTEQTGRAIPRRTVADPTVLRAMAHPTRLRLLEALYEIGEATATELAERFDMSPANCSWHLRQLAKHGFVEEAGGGTGRQRPWKVVRQSLTIGSLEDGPPGVNRGEFAAARDTLVDVLMGRELEAWRAWHASQEEEPPEWREASAVIQSNFIWMTADELAAFKAELNAVYGRHVLPHLDRIGSPDRPVGSRPTRIVAWAIPFGEPHPGPAAGDDERAGADQGAGADQDSGADQGAGADHGPAPTRSNPGGEDRVT